MEEQLNEEEAARERHRKRIEQMQRSKRRQMLFRKFAPPVAGTVIVLMLAFFGVRMLRQPDIKSAGDEKRQEDVKEKVLDSAVGEKGGEDTGAVQADEADKEEQKDETGSAETAAADGSNEKPASKAEVMQQFLKGSGFLPGGSGAALVEQSAMPQVTAAWELLEESGRGKIHKANTTENTITLDSMLASGDEFFSAYAVLIDLESESILAQKDYKTRINPASMTKILTVLVAAEHIEPEDLDDTLTITLDITDYGFRHKCSSAGFDKDEVVTVRDLFYGTVLPSGADAAVGLAVYVAGSQEAFVELMNEKLEELGLSETSHFTNCVGVFDEDHYSTVYDIAMILEAAVDNEMCRDFLSAHIYTTSETEQHPEGIELSNWFLRRIEDKDSGGEVVYAKTGYVEQSGSCAASYAESKDGKGYVCVTVMANSPWRCIYDHSGLYKQFLE